MIVLIVLVTVDAVTRLMGGASGSAAPGIIYAAAPSGRGAYHVGGKGVYNYGYNTGDGIAKVEVRHGDGSVTGSYRYFDPLGRQIIRSYIADKRGFRVLGNELPVAPDTPAIGFPEAQIITGPVEGAKEFTSPNIVVQRNANLVLRNTIDETLPKYTSYIYQNHNNNERDTSTYIPLTKDFEYPYFYSSDNILYDFPAGFAYPTVPVKLVLRPLGVTGEHESLFLSAGHTPGRKAIKVRPVYTSRRSSSNTIVQHKRPFIIGHAR